VRLFVAVEAGDELRAEATRVRSTVEAELHRTCRELPRIVWVSPLLLHVTLRFLGDVDDSMVADLERALSTPMPVAPFDVEWRGLGTFPGPRDPRAFWIGAMRGADGLGALEAEVSRRLQPATGTGRTSAETEQALRSLNEEARPFRPHVTLGRVKSRGVGADWRRVLEAAEVRGARTRVDHVSLLRSTLSPRGPAYTPIVVSPLAGGR
jgi:2'-5' RNA ligase